MAWSGLSCSQTDAVGTASMGNIKVFEVSTSGSLGFFNFSVYISLYTTDWRIYTLFLHQQYTHMSILWDWRVIIIQRLKTGLIHRGVSRADQRDLGEDRTENVKSCSLLNTETSIFLRAPSCPQRRSWSKLSLQRWAQKMIWPQPRSTSVFHFTFTSLRLPAWAPRHCPCFRLSCVCAAGKTVWISMKQSQRCITNTREQWLKMT